MFCLRYTASQLKQLGRSLTLKNVNKPRISADLYGTIKQLDILNASVRITHRGCRSGLRVSKRITIISNGFIGRSRILTQVGVNLSNIVSIPSQIEPVDFSTRNGFVCPSETSETVKKSRGANVANLALIRRDPKIHFISTKLQFCHFNAQSARNKTGTISDYICDRKVDICAITESWLKEGDTVKENELKPNGYTVKSIPRSDRGGGGIALIYKTVLKPKLKSAFEKDSFECTEWTVTLDNSRINIIVVYRTPYSLAHPVTEAVFLEEFSEYLETVLVLPGSLIITGDFNLHVDVPDDANATKFLQILDSCGLIQHIHEPTHRNGHTLDLLITREDERILHGTPLVDFMISDHISLLTKLHVPKPPLIVKEVTFRKLRSIDVEAFSADLASSELVVNPPNDLGELVSAYSSTLGTLLDKHAPEKTRNMVDRPKEPWYTDQIKQEKLKRK